MDNNIEPNTNRATPQVPPKPESPQSKPPISEHHAEPSYTVMPQMNGNYAAPEPEPAQAPAPAPTPSAAPADHDDHVLDSSLEPNEHMQVAASPNPFNNRLTYIIIAVIILIVLGALAYFMLWSGNSGNQTATESKLPKTWLVKYFNAEVCNDQATCGDDADPDNDGLSNYDEFKITRTDLTTADTDGDGIADGDEANIYKTDPTLKFTDTRAIAETNGYTDGNSIFNGYDPLTPGFKFTQTRAQQITEDTNKFGLHQPTPATLAGAVPVQAEPATESNETSVTNPSPKSVTVFIENGEFNPASVAINVGDTLIWLNKDSTSHQIASDPHPTHNQVAGLLSEQLTASGTYSFRFDTAGTFVYHDELNTDIKGTVQVK